MVRRSEPAPAAHPHGAPIAVTVPKGATASDIAALLEQRGIVADAGAFSSYVTGHGQGGAFQPGVYHLRAGTGYDALIRALDAGPLAAHELVVPEGFRITEIEHRLRSVGIDPKAYARALRAADPPPGFGHPRSMEGFLFPATYPITARERPRALIAQQLAAFRHRFSSVDLTYARSKNLTPYDVLVIASMIEREAHVARDRPLVSAVIYNRLHDGMPLQIDATLRYALGSWTGPLTVSELHSHNPYNTRVLKGLPPTPICNPGLASIRAAAHPAHVDYLYYVAIGSTGRQYFTSSYAEFKAHGG